MTEFTRADGRALDQMRSVRITRNFTTNPAGSVLVEFGNTRVMCTASVGIWRAALQARFGRRLAYRRVRHAAFRDP